MANSVHVSTIGLTKLRTCGHVRNTLSCEVDREVRQIEFFERLSVIFFHTRQ